MNIKKAFTVVEMMIVVVILSVGLLGIIATMNYAYKFMFDTKNNLQAINIARSGIEGVFNLRNTNWQRWSGKKDSCWLKVNPMVDDGTVGCENDTWFGSGKSYILELTGTQKYFALTEKSPKLELTGKILSSDYQYLVCKKDGIITACPGTEKPANYFTAMPYFLQVRGGYLLDKKNNSFMNCDKGNDSGCSDGRFLEKNFCVDVMYFDGNKKSITFCSVLTNFKKE